MICDTDKSKHVVLVQTHQGQVLIHVMQNKNATQEQMNLAPAHQRQMKTIKTSFENISSEFVHIKKLRLIWNRSKISQMKN